MRRFIDHALFVAWALLAAVVAGIIVQHGLPSAAPAGTANLDQCIAATEQDLVEWPQLRPMLVTLFAGTSAAAARAVVAYAIYLRYPRAARVLPELVALANAASAAPR